MTKHARFSPSKLELLEGCPCFEQEQFVQNEAAERGTLKHEAMETNDDSKLLDEEHDQIRIARLLRDSLLTGITPDETLQEVKLEVTVEEYQTFGTADLLVLYDEGKAAFLMDYKFGQEAVTPAEKNMQLQCYVLGAFQKYPSLERITGVLICPNQWAATDEGDQAKGVITMHEYTQADILNLSTRVMATLAACNDPNKQPTTHEKACRFCSIKAQCPALKEIAMDIARKYTGLPLPEEFSPDRMVSARDRVLAQVLAQILEDWAAQIKKNNTEAVKEQDLDLPGYSLRSRKGGHTINNAMGMLELASQEYHIPVEHLTPVLSVSVTKLVNQIKSAVEKGVSAQSIKDKLIEQASLIDGLVEERPNVTFLQRDRGVTLDAVLELLPPEGGDA